MTRAKIQAVRIKTPNRPIILAGFNAGAAIALQVALAEPVNSIVCLGLAYNTLNGVRGVPDDRLLELTAPILFVIGENAQRSRYFRNFRENSNKNIINFSVFSGFTF